MKENIAYFPGCIDSQRTNLSDIFKGLDLKTDLIPVSEWNCCGAPPAHYKPSFFNKVVMPLRNLGISRRNGYSSFYSGCQVCVKQTNDAVKIAASEPMFARRAAYSLEPFDAKLGADTASFPAAIHLMDIMVRPEVKEAVLSKAVRNLKGRSILLYNGCYKDAENIEEFKSILNILGAEVSLYGECCGGGKLRNATPVYSERVENANAAYAFFKLINRKADETNSDYILAACSMCERNIGDGIEMSSRDVFAPVIGLAEFAGFLLGIEGCGNLLPDDAGVSSSCCV